VIYRSLDQNWPDSWRFRLQGAQLAENYLTEKLHVLRIQGMIARMEKEAADSETKFQYLGTGKCW